MNRVAVYTEGMILIVGMISTALSFVYAEATAWNKLKDWSNALSDTKSLKK